MKWFPLLWKEKDKYYPMQQTLTIIVPIYNEEDNLLRVEKELATYLDTSLVKADVLLVNDGSSDKSQKVILKICERDDRFSYLSFKENRGLSAALKAGFDHVQSDLVGYIDADLQTTPSDFNLLLKEIENFDLVTGVRSDRQDSFVKNMSSSIANGIRRAFTHDGMDDTGCPLKIIKTDYAKRIPMFKGLHRFLPAMILLQNGKIKQVPVRHFPRIAGEAKYHLWNRLFGPLADCFAYLWMKRKYINYQIADSSAKLKKQ